MNRIFIDMDGVLADYAGYARLCGISEKDLKRVPRAFAELPLIPGAIEGVAALEAMGFDLWIASKPPTACPGAYADKVEWVCRHFPALRRKIILTHDKGLLGNDLDFLLDDRPDFAWGRNFRGTVIQFGVVPASNWIDTAAYFAMLRKRNR